jgi:threonine/homoserine/homoserine lactone efflux protein
MRFGALIALVTFVAVGSGSPGPNNTLLLASGVTFGFRRTLPHVVGTFLGIGLLVTICAAGVGVAFATVPNAQLSLKIVGSVYLVYLATRLAAGHAISHTTVSKPLNVWQAAAFQFVNPKGWVFSLAVVSAFAPVGGWTIPSVALLVAVIAIVVAITACVWAGGGAALSRALDTERTGRTVGMALAILMIASIAFLWI